MKKTNLLLTLIMLVGAITSSWAAERTAPTLPTPVELTSGKSYYLYNVETGKFLSLYNSYPNIDTYGIAVIPEIQEDGSYTLKISGKYIYAQSTYTSTQTSINKQCYFTIATTTDGYTIQRAPSNTSYYKAEQYLGFVDGSDNNRITPDVTEGNIVWQFMEAETAEYYFAKHKLYTALEAMNGFDYEIGYYEAIYNNAASTNDLLTETATRLTNAMELTSAYTFPEWNDYPILLENDENKSWSVLSEDLRFDTRNQQTATLTARFTVDQDVVLVYIPTFNSALNMKVFVDGVENRILSSPMHEGNLYRYFISLSAGNHVVQFVYNRDIYSYDFYGSIDEIGIEKTPTISVNLLEPGSLGTEVLYNVNHVKDVRRLKVKGKMNADDWAKIKMMTNLFSLDLSEAIFSEIPKSQFYRTNEQCQFLHELTLPEGLESIGDYAFYYSNIETINFPSTLKSIGYYAFLYSMLEKAILADSITSIRDRAFEHCSNLREVYYPKSMTYVPEWCFSCCENLSKFSFHEGLTSIHFNAFSSCESLNPRFPKSLNNIGANAFSNCSIDSLIVHENCSFVSSSGYYSTFQSCDNMVYAEFPSSFCNIAAKNMIKGNKNLKEVVFKSPSVVGGSYKDSFLDGCGSPTIKVPSFLVNSYKLDEYWYNYNIEGFSTADIKTWNIYGKVVLNERERMEGTPNINLIWSASMKINGTTAMDIDSLCIDADGNDTTYTAKFLSNCENIRIKGQLRNLYWMTAKKWYFVSMPFDFKVGDVTATASNAKFVLRYYDGESRAANGASGNWKNYAADDTIKAGTGFIIQASVDTRCIFTALDNESKQYMVSNKEFVKALEANPSEKASNKGWNLVGNPWQTFYNIHILNFTAPITIYNVSKKTYTAYSIIDDDIAIEPNQAFFVQCPDDVTSISFPETGRQLTSAIEKQQDVITTVGISNRQLIELTVSCDSLSDKTRIVFNEKSSSTYETHCDASKFFSLEAGVPQLYTIGEDGVQYAINERPTLDGSVKLGFSTDRKGQFTISAQRNDGMSIELTDLETGITHDLTASDYIFSAGAGSHDDRFILTLGKGNGTSSAESAFAQAKSIKAVENGVEISGIKGNIEVFAIDGRCIASATADGNALTISTGKGMYIVKTADKTEKVIVK